MLSMKKLLSATLCMASLAGSVAFAGGLTIVNNTNHDSTAILNGGACSTILGDMGITRAHSTNTVTDAKIRFACLGHWSDCSADVYMTNNCTGPVVGKVRLDVNKGIIPSSVVVLDPSYRVTTNGFSATIDGGPDFAW